MAPGKKLSVDRRKFLKTAAASSVATLAVNSRPSGADPIAPARATVRLMSKQAEAGNPAVAEVLLRRARGALPSLALTVTAAAASVAPPNSPTGLRLW